MWQKKTDRKIAGSTAVKLKYRSPQGVGIVYVFAGIVWLCLLSLPWDTLSQSCHGSLALQL